MVVGVLANTGGASRNIKKFRGDVKTTGSVATNAAKKMGNFVATITGLGGILSAGGIIYSLGKAAEHIDGVAKSAAKLNIGTDRLVGLNHAAEQTGVSTESLDKGLEKLLRNTSDAAKGTGLAVEAFDRMGLSAERLNKLGVDEQMELIADGMENVKDQGDKVRLSMALFGREGGNLLNTLKLGSKGLQQYHDDAKRLGLVFSSEEAAKVEKFNDEMDRLKKATGSLGQKIIIDIAPAAAETINGFLLYVNRYQTGKDESRELPASQKIIKREQQARFRDRELTAKLGPQHERILREAGRGLKLQRSAEAGRMAGGKALLSTFTKLGKIGVNLKKNLDPVGDKLASSAKDLKEATLKGGLMAAVAPRQVDEALVEKIAAIGRGTATTTADPGVTGDRINSLLERGTSEAFLALRANVTGRNQDDIPKRQLDVLNSIDSNMEAIASRPPQELETIPA